MTLSRRHLIKGMTMVPLVAKTRPVPQEPQNGEPHVPVADNLALNVVRLFNTIELHFKSRYGKFGTRDELFSATSAAWFVNDRAAKKHHLDDEFFRALRLGDDEIVSGWKLSIVKSEDEQAYALTLARTNESIRDEENLIFVSDEQGVIFVGGIGAEREVPNHYRPAESWRGTIPIDESPLIIEKLSAFSKALRNLAFAGLQSVRPLTCACTCSCQSSGQCYCYNQGCRVCPWCCTANCTGCVLACGSPCACCK